MKRWIYVWLTLLLTLGAARAAVAGSDPVFTLDPDAVDRGAAMAVIAEGLPPDASLSGKFEGRTVVFVPQPGRIVGLFGADVGLKPGKHPLTLAWKIEKGKAQSRTIQVEVKEKDYGTRTIEVKDSQVNLSKEDLARHQRERKLIVAALAARSKTRLWKGPWMRPTGGPVISAFGRKTVINGQLRSAPHSGVDLDGLTGDPVAAPAAGRVVLAGDHFFAGGSVYLDHGQGLITMCFHLSEILVKTGDVVEKGQLLGKVGETGRVTGPHLHYGLYLNGARIDPLSFHELVGRLGLD